LRQLVRGALFSATSYRQRFETVNPRGSRAPPASVALFTKLLQTLWVVVFEGREMLV